MIALGCRLGTSIILHANHNRLVDPERHVQNSKTRGNTHLETSASLKVIGLPRKIVWSFKAADDAAVPDLLGDYEVKIHDEHQSHNCFIWRAELARHVEASKGVVSTDHTRKQARYLIPLNP